VKLDAIIMMINTSMQHTWKKLEMVTTYDYRSIVVPLLKSFMRVCFRISGLFNLLNFLVAFSPVNDLMFLG
jgi:hypothetical protein